jgi:hypothetical protein
VTVAAIGVRTIAPLVLVVVVIGLIAVLSIRRRRDR